MLVVTGMTTAGAHTQPRFPRPAIVRAAVEGLLRYGLTASSFSELPIVWEKQLHLES